MLENGERVYSKVIPSRFDSVLAGITLLKAYVKEYGEKPEKLVVTGYGRVNFPEGLVITEIICQGRGCHAYFPDHAYILDLGGQDAKVIKKSPEGKIVQFIMIDKFSESEVITMLAKGIPKPEVIAGLFKSTAKRLANFVESVGHPECLIFTGGGAHYNLLVRFLERELKGDIVIPPEPELTAALGAALLA